jgi:hypothetical protein
VKAGDRFEKDPDRRVQDAVTLVFDKVEELGSGGAYAYGKTTASLTFGEHGVDPHVCSPSLFV